MYRKETNGWLKHWDFILLDLFCLHLSYILTYRIRMGKWWPYQNADYATLAVVVTIASLLEILAFGTFSNVLRRRIAAEIRITAKHVLIVFAVLSLYMFSMKSGATYSRIFVYVETGLYFLLGVAFRLLLKRIVRDNRPKRALFIIASADTVEETIRELKDDAIGYAIEICGAAVTDEVRSEEIASVRIEKLDERALLKRLSQEWVDEVLINLPSDSEKIKEMREKVLEMGITLHIPVKKNAGRNTEQIVENIGGYTVLTTSIRSAGGAELFLKRCLDILGGLLGCVLTLLICLVIGPIIRKKSPGPLFYRHERIGRNGKRFMMYKIRSMVMNADEMKADLMEKNRISDGRMFKLDWDPRIIGNEELPDGTRKTGIGEFIRRTSLDEFPQFFNVLKGDMSLVGTRPPTVDEWEKYDLHHRARMATKPGITGLWQVSGRSDITDFEEVVRLDTEYICNWSLWLDIRILLKTVKSVLHRDGAL